jgi:Uma2 family endonuclease
MSLIVHTYLSFLEAARNWLENSSIGRWIRESTLYNSAMLAQETNPDTLPARIRWSVEDYYKMAEAGLFDQRRVELIDGEIIEMSPMGSPHAVAAELTANALRNAFGAKYIVRNGKPLSLPGASQPEPDVSVHLGTHLDFISQHPSTAELVVEVSDSTLSFDRAEKSSLYANAKIAEYWIVNLKQWCIEVHRNPVEDMTRHFGFRYDSVQSFKKGASIALLSNGASIAVSDILP